MESSMLAYILAYIKDDKERQSQFREGVKNRIGKKSLTRWIEMLICTQTMTIQEYEKKTEEWKKMTQNQRSAWVYEFQRYYFTEKKNPGFIQRTLDLYWLTFPECFPKHYNQLTLF